MTKEEKWAQTCGMNYSISGDTITVDRAALRLLIQRMEWEADHHATLNVRLADIKKAVSDQANDEGLWFVATTVPEIYLQQELRRLHSIIETSVNKA